MSYRLIFDQSMNVVSIECLLCNEKIEDNRFVNNPHMTPVEMTTILEEIHGEHACEAVKK